MTDELAQIIHENFNKCRGRNGVSPSALAEEIERSDWLRKVKADAIREAAIKAQESFVAEQDGIGYAGVRTSWLFDEADRIDRGEDD